MKLYNFLYVVLFVFITPLFAESFVDGDSFTNGESFTGGSSFVGGDSFVSGDSFTDGNSFTGGESFTGGKGQKIGVYESVVESSQSNIYANTTESVYEDVYSNVYVNGYGKYLKLVTAKGVNAQANFVKYFSDWQWSGQKQDFFSYAESRAEQEKQLELCYNKALAKFGVGTAIVATTWIVSFVVPGGSIYQAAVIIIAKATTAGALSGGMSGAVMSAGIAYLQGKRGDELLCETINGAADGYLIGAITGVVSGGAKVYKLSKEANALKDISGVETIFDGNVYDESGKLIGKYEPEWYPKQKTVRDIEKNGLNKLSNTEKGNYGEMKQDIFMHEHGYERISKTQVTNITEKAPQGIDGVYYNPNGNPPYIIAEAKCGYQNSVGEFFGTKALSSPADGIEMSENWIYGNITGNNRLENAVGKAVADKIEMEGYQTVLTHVNSKTGECTVYVLDSSVNDVTIVGKW